jgi:hypothetical protein
MDDNDPTTNRSLRDAQEYSTDAEDSFMKAMAKVLRGFEARMIAAFHSYDNYADGITAHHTDDAL